MTTIISIAVIVAWLLSLRFTYRYAVRYGAREGIGRYRAISALEQESPPVYDEAAFAAIRTSAAYKEGYEDCIAGQKRRAAQAVRP